MIPKPRSRRTENSRSTAIASRATISQSGSTRKRTGFTSLLPALAPDHRQKLYRSRRRCVCIHDALARRSGQPENLSRLAAQQFERRSGRRYPGGGCLYRADVDDGPTGKIENYPNGLTNYLLDGLKERGAKATFFECGYRIKEYSACMPRQLEEGSEIATTR